MINRMFYLEHYQNALVYETTVLNYNNIFPFEIWKGVHFTNTMLCQCVQKFGGRGWRGYQGSCGSASGINLIGWREGLLKQL